MPKQNYKSHFQDILLEDEQFKQWLQKHPNLEMAKCKICKKDISVGSDFVTREVGGPESK